MAWTATHVFTTGEVVTAATMNAISGDLDALNQRINHSATTAGSSTRASATYGDLVAGAGPTLSNVTTGTFAWVVLYAHFANNTNTGQSIMGFAVSGATTIAAADSACIGRSFATAANDGIYIGGMFPVTLTAGNNTFTAKYRSAGADTATIDNRMIGVITQL